MGSVVATNVAVATGEKSVVATQSPSASSSLYGSLRTIKADFLKKQLEAVKAFVGAQRAQREAKEAKAKLASEEQKQKQSAKTAAVAASAQSAVVKAVVNDNKDK